MKDIIKTILITGFVFFVALPLFASYVEAQSLGSNLIVNSSLNVSSGGGTAVSRPFSIEANKTYQWEYYYQMSNVTCAGGEGDSCIATEHIGLCHGLNTGSPKHCEVGNTSFPRMFIRLGRTTPSALTIPPTYPINDTSFEIAPTNVTVISFSDTEYGNSRRTVIVFTALQSTSEMYMDIEHLPNENKFSLGTTGIMLREVLPPQATVQQQLNSLFPIMFIIGSIAGLIVSMFSKNVMGILISALLIIFSLSVYGYLI